MGRWTNSGCLLLFLLLSGCGGASGLSQIGLGEPGGSLSGWASAGEASENADGAPPLPERNAARSGVGRDGGDRPLLSLPSLASAEIFTAASAEPSAITQWREKPVGVYTILAKQIYACWLNAAAPKLEDHGLHAEVGAGGTEDATIIIYKKDNNGKRGLQALRIEIQPSISGSTVEAKNRRLDKSQELGFRSDLARWSEGSQECAI